MAQGQASSSNHGTISAAGGSCCAPCSSSGFWGLWLLLGSLLVPLSSPLSLSLKALALPLVPLSVPVLLLLL